jgi:uncharacterized protein
MVANKCILIADNKPELSVDSRFVFEASMVHDIGIYLTDAPEILCFGEYQYICHGYLGADIMRNEGYPKHALVCERHTGTGISKEEIIQKSFPLPDRTYIPESIEEQLVCFCDKFFSKTKPGYEKTVDEVRKSISRFGEDAIKRFDLWCDLFL